MIKLNLSLHDCCTSVGETVCSSAVARLLILTVIFQIRVTIQRSSKQAQILFGRIGLMRDELRNKVERR